MKTYLQQYENHIPKVIHCGIVHNCKTFKTIEMFMHKRVVECTVMTLHSGYHSTIKVVNEYCDFQATLPSENSAES